MNKFASKCLEKRLTCKSLRVNLARLVKLNDIRLKDFPFRIPVPSFIQIDIILVTLLSFR
jgi:hypothetical protein